MVDQKQQIGYNSSMNKTIIDTTKWIATTITLSGAVLASLNIYPASAMVLNTGSLIFLVWSLMIRDRAMITVNAGLLAIYSIGLTIKLL